MKPNRNPRKRSKAVSSYEPQNPRTVYKNALGILPTHVPPFRIPFSIHVNSKPFRFRESGDVSSTSWLMGVGIWLPAPPRVMPILLRWLSEVTDIVGRGHQFSNIEQGALHLPDPPIVRTLESAVLSSVLQ